MCEGSEESPIKHLRLLEQLETIDDEEDKLKEIVAIVGYFAFLMSGHLILRSISGHFVLNLYLPQSQLLFDLCQSLTTLIA